ncbi:hypothetical protein [Sinomicrobium weinanense]|uniref:Uncharacterized protein n=1 Tax=Sinomicrobium weinanense TaxID=2842200 RepID=A0A926Q4F7_9FLAO|nr:hypothetical protein [Sinomicrobium weinanense]MBC9796840.1 hypothetical protein [Sinomicrobium weinanense]MBU3125213.1 hypothetical protein [Sinomicrobium weinanense]
MKTLGDQIALDPQFAVELPKNKNSVLSTLLRVNNPSYKITRVDDRIFIAMSEKKEEWWSPQLQLEVNRIDESRSMLSGWVAPRSLLWNTLLGLQLLAGFTFMGCAIWVYLNWTAGTVILPLVLAILMVPAWITLYFVRRSGKSKGRPFIYGFYEFLNNRALLN